MLQKVPRKAKWAHVLGAWGRFPEPPEASMVTRVFNLSSFLRRLAPSVVRTERLRNLSVIGLRSLSLVCTAFRLPKGFGNRKVLCSKKSRLPVVPGG